MNIHVDDLVLEVTRKCNMQCAHCLRGKCQNLDMTKDIVDKTFENINSIRCLTFSGGEPFLNLEIIKYTLEVVKEKNISIDSFYIVTNGKQFKDENIEVLNQWYEYIISQQFDLSDELYPTDKIILNEIMNYGGVCVSRDEYHEPIPILNYLKYRSLSYYLEDKEHPGNMNLINEGLAKENGIGTIEQGYLDLSVEEEPNNDLSIYDILYINAKGDVLGDCDASYESQDSLSVGNLKENSLFSILSELLEKEEIA